MMQGNGLHAHLVSRRFGKSTSAQGNGTTTMDNGLKVSIRRQKIQNDHKTVSRWALALVRPWPGLGESALSPLAYLELSESI